MVNTKTGEIIEDKTDSANKFEKKHNIKKEDTLDVINKYKPESLQFTEQQEEYETTDIEEEIDDLMA
mgnify:CR=1 FL=1